MSSLFKKMQVVLATLLLTAIVSQGHSTCNQFLTCSEEEILCPCTPTCHGQGFLSADLLYWRAFEDGLNDCFPIEDFDDVSSSGNIISKFKGKAKDPRFKWEAGFRLGTGYEFASGWDIAAYWTYFHSHSHQHDRNEYPLENSYETHWKLNFEVVDLLLGYSFDVGSCFTWRPFGGLRGARIKQKLRTNFVNETKFYSNSSSPNFLDAISSSYSTNYYPSGSNNKEKFLGIGPLIGIEADWKLGCGFSLYANASLATLYGHFHVHLNESNEFSNGADFYHVRRSLHACQAVIDAGLGIRWQTHVCNNLVWLQLGLEHHRYFNQNRFGDYGDLCLDGANFSAGMAF